mgnify:CR=1 FL=1
MKEILEGLMLLKEIYGEWGDFAAEHDQIFAGPDLGEENLELLKVDGDEEAFKPVSMSDEDFVKLSELGWFIDSEFNCWSHFC